jgi:hypothetical protein
MNVVENQPKIIKHEMYAEKLISQLVNSDMVNAFYKNLIEKRSIIKNHYYVFKENGIQICCIHKNIELYGDSITNYINEDGVCKYCHQEIGDMEIDNIRHTIEHQQDVMVNIEDPKDVIESINIDNLSNDAKFAYHVLKYLCQNGRYEFTTPDISDIINLFSDIIKMSDVNEYVVIYNDYCYKSDSYRKNLPINIEQLKKMKRGLIDKYLLLVISIIIYREMKTPSKQGLQSILREEIEHLSDETLKFKFPNFLSSVPFLSTAKITNTLISKMTNIHQFTLININGENKNYMDYSKYILEIYYNIVSPKYHIGTNRNENKTEIQTHDESTEESTYKVDNEPPMITHINYKNYQEYETLLKNIDLRTTYLNYNMNRIINHLIDEIYKYISNDTNIHESIIQYLPEPKCIKTQIELEEKSEGAYDIICSNIVDLYIDCLMDNMLKMDSIDTHPMIMISHISHIETIRNIRRQIPKDVIDSFDQITTRISQINEELSELFRKKKQLLSYQPLENSQRILKTSMVLGDYSYRIFNESQHLHHISDNHLYSHDNVNDVDVSQIKYMIHKFNPEKAKHIIDFYGINHVNHLDDIVTEANKIFAYNLNLLVSMDNTVKDRYRLIKLHEERYNFIWKKDIIEALWKKETSCNESMINSNLRGYIHYLHLMVSRLKNRGEFLPLIRTDKNYKTIFSNFTYIMDDISIDKLIGMSNLFITDSPSIFENDKFKSVIELPQRLKMNQINLMLKYIIALELVGNYRQISSVTHRDKYITVIKHYLYKIFLQHDVNNYSSDEINKLNELSSIENRNKRTIAPVDRDQKIIWLEIKKISGFEPQEKLENVEKKMRSIEGDDEYQNEDNVGEFGGEIDEDFGFDTDLL